MRNRIDCPLCDWHLDADPPVVAPATLAHVFGMGVMTAAAVAQHAGQVERDLRKHLETHSLVEWVRKVTELQGEVAALKGEGAPMPDLRTGNPVESLWGAAARARMPEQAISGLRRGRVTTVAGLLKSDAWDLTGIPLFGDACLAEVRRPLAVHGLALKGERP